MIGEAQFVLDASVVMSWCFEDEADQYADAVLTALENRMAIVPVLWTLEVANVLLIGERRGRISSAESDAFVRMLSRLPIEVDVMGSDRGIHGVLSVGRSVSVTAYDAAYLSLAMRRGVPLATLDSRLQEAARCCGVQLFAPGRGTDVTPTD